MDEGATAPEPEDADNVDEVQPARRRLAAQSPQHAPVPGPPLCRHSPKVGAQCGSSARWDLCGGRGAISVPTAIAAVHRTADPAAETTLVDCWASTDGTYGSQHAEASAAHRR